MNNNTTQNHQDLLSLNEKRFIWELGVLTPHVETRKKDEPKHTIKLKPGQKILIDRKTLIKSHNESCLPNEIVSEDYPKVPESLRDFFAYETDAVV